MYGTHLAAENGKSELLEYLFREGADWMLRTCRINTVLHIAARSNKADCVKITLRTGNEKWIVSRLLWIANLYQSELPDCLFAYVPKDIICVISIYLAQLCLSFGELFEAKNGDGYMALEVAMRGRCHSVIPYLVSPVTVRSLSTTMGSPLHYAASCGCAEACRLLLALGANVNATNQRCETALFRACCAYPESPEAVQEILKYHPNTRIRDNDGKLAYDMAVNRKYFEIKNLLDQYEKNVPTISYASEVNDDIIPEERLPAYRRPRAKGKK